MTPNCRWIQALVLRVQNEFLENPVLNLTLPQAQQRFGIDRITCEAILGALLDAGVLSKTPEGTYVRCIPRFTAHAGTQWTWPSRVTSRPPSEKHAA